MNEVDYIDPWWKRIGCMRDPGVHTGEEAAMVSEINELREALQPDPDAIDYRGLLREYMRVMRRDHGRNTIRWTRQARPMTGLTDDELKALDEIEQEVDSE